MRRRSNRRALRNAKNNFNWRSFFLLCRSDGVMTQTRGFQNWDTETMQWNFISHWLQAWRYCAIEATVSFELWWFRKLKKPFREMFQPLAQWKDPSLWVLLSDWWCQWPLTLYSSCSSPCNFSLSEFLHCWTSLPYFILKSLTEQDWDLGSRNELHCPLKCSARE